MKIFASLTISLFVLLAGFVPRAPGQCGGHEWIELLASDGTDHDEFGTSVFMKGNAVIVGAPESSVLAPHAGAAYVYQKRGVFWDETRLTASRGAASDRFGVSVAIDGDVAVVGAFYDDTLGDGAGAAYVYRYDGAGWTEEQKLLASDGAAQDQFGGRVAVSGDVIVVGAYWHDHGISNSGSAYVFRYQGGVWSEEQELTAARDADVADHFGLAVAVEGDVALIGAPQDDDFATDAGSVYVFRREGSVWVKRQKLTASDPGDTDVFGFAVSLDGDTALIGAFRDDAASGPEAGSAYVFREQAGSFVEMQELLPLDGTTKDYFGISVSLDGDQAVIGAHGNDDAGSASGSAYVFRFDGSTWIEQWKLTASNAASQDWFGCSVSMSGNLAVIGARESDGTGTDMGSAYLFRLTPLALDVEPELVAAGDRITLTTCGGLAGAPVMLALVEVNGIPLFHQLAVTVFGGNGVWALSAIVPPGLTGFEFGFQSFGMISPGKLGGSNREWVTFL